MIVLNTNGKYEYSSFCTPGNSEVAERWLDNYKDFIVQHRENLIFEFHPKEKYANIYIATIPSERKDINGSPCDTSLTAIKAEYGSDDYAIMSSLAKYAINEGIDSLGGIFDSHFKEDFFNVSNQDYIQSPDKEENVQNRLYKMYEKHIKDSKLDGKIDLPSLESDQCLVKSVKNVNPLEFENALKIAQSDTESTKFILMITRLNVSEDKVKRFAITDDNKSTKAIIFRTAVLDETDWTSLVIKKKKMSFPMKVGIATVAAGILTLVLMILFQPSKNLEPKVEQSLKNGSPARDSVTRALLPPGTYTDGNLTLRVTDSTLQMFDANDSLIQGFIFRCDSVRKVDE